MLKNRVAFSLWRNWTKNVSAVGVFSPSILIEQMPHLIVTCALFNMIKLGQCWKSIKCVSPWTVRRGQPLSLSSMNWDLVCVGCVCVLLGNVTRVFTYRHDTYKNPICIYVILQCYRTKQWEEVQGILIHSKCHDPDSKV